MSATNAAVAIYDSPFPGREAVKELQRSGLDMKKLSIVGKDYHNRRASRRVLQYRRPHEILGKLGAFWGGSGKFVRSRVLRHPRHRPGLGSWPSRRVDCRSSRGRAVVADWARLGRDCIALASLRTASEIRDGDQV